MTDDRKITAPDRDALPAVEQDDNSASAPTFPAWTGTRASARLLAALVKEVDKYAEVESDVEPGAYFFGTPTLHIDTVPNHISLNPGDRPVFDGTQWSVEKAEVTS